MEFTTEQQAHIDQLLSDSKLTWETDVLTPILAERDELLQLKPTVPTEQDNQIKQLQAQLLHNSVVSMLKQADLEDFTDFLQVDNVDDLQGKLDKLSTVLDARKINTSFEPDNKRSTSAYDQAASKNDVNGMISAKFSKFFN